MRQLFSHKRNVKWIDLPTDEANHFKWQFSGQSSDWHIKQ